MALKAHKYALLGSLNLKVAAGWIIMPISNQVLEIMTSKFDALDLNSLGYLLITIIMVKSLLHILKICFCIKSCRKGLRGTLASPLEFRDSEKKNRQ